jgi:hypothetical protein
MDFPRNNAIKTVFISWLIVGTLDITCATINYMIGGGTNPISILVYISSGIYGPEAFKIGPPSMAILGILLHYLIAGIWTVIFYTFYARIPALSKNRLLTGIGYGLLVWTMMNQVVVKLSNTPKGPFKLSSAIINAAILCVAIGIPLSYRAYKFYYGKTEK